MHHDSTTTTPAKLPDRVCKSPAHVTPFTFTPHSNRQDYCTKECKDDARRARNRTPEARAKARSEYDPERSAEYQRKYRETHPEQIRSYQRSQYARNAEAYRQQQRERRAGDPEKVRAEARARRANDPDRYRLYGRLDYLKHREKRKAQSRAWNAERKARLEAAARLLASQPAKKKRGRIAEQEQGKSYFQIGEAVERLIPDDAKNDRLSIIAARKAVADQSPYDYDVVAQYHGAFRRRMSPKRP
jgi:hypothetical protein